MVSGILREKSRGRLSFTNDFPLGLSNEIVGDFAKITAHGGAVLVLMVNEAR
ncbi:MAG: hypothetical protein ACI4JT_09110 [Oscillospiraceae bacterium]